MTDKSATQNIASITTELATYWVNDIPSSDYYDKITVEEKAGDMAYIIWYQLWRKGRVVKEINSRFVISVEYDDPKDEPIPF